MHASKGEHVSMSRGDFFRIGKSLVVCFGVLFCFTPLSALADHVREDFIGVLLYRIATNIHWANSSKISQYHLHVIDEDSAIADQLSKIAGMRSLHETGFNVTFSENAEIPKGVHLVYLSSSKSGFFEAIREKVLNKNVLLVSHNIDDDAHIFLNLVDTKDDKIHFSLNKANVINQNLGIDPDIILLGGSEVDVALLYRQGQEKLTDAKKQLKKIVADIRKITSDRTALSEKLKERQEELAEQSNKLVLARDKVKQLSDQLSNYQGQLIEFSDKLKESQITLNRQEGLLMRQTSTIAEQRQVIDKQKALQAKINDELQAQRQEIEKQTLALDERSRHLDKQKREIELRSSILKDQQSQIDSQTQRINSQKDTILHQEDKIRQQSEEMSHRGKIIADQRTYLFLMSLLAGMAVLIMGLIYRNSRHSKRINEQLTEQRDLLSRSAIELAKARDMADKANQAKSSFLANMSHELRTPLNAVLGFSEFLAGDSNLSEKQVRYINIVNSSGQHLLSMINDVLDISKIEAGMVSVELESVAIRELCGDVVSILSAKAESSGLELIMEIDESVPDYLVTDSVKLRQILINLIGNAIKFGKNKKIELTVNATENREKLQLKVRDYGVGISKENQAAIFRPFSQVGEVSANRKGTGLGLAISRQYALLMGGDLNVESSLGNGALFTCALPLRVGSGSSAKILPFNRRIIGLEAHCVKRSLLVVDDHEESRILLNNILTKVGFHVEEAANGAIAVDKFKENQIDLIFMDINMPVMDGIEATRKIRLTQAGEEVKIIAITANARKEQLQLIQSEHFDDIIFKPFRISQIFDVVANHLNAKFKYEHERRSSLSQRQTVDSITVSEFNIEYIDQLIDAARQLDVALFDEILGDMKESKGGKGLIHLAQDFRFDTIIRILEEAKNIRERNGIA